MTEPQTVTQWLDEDAGPVVRPYALTGGRTRSSGDTFDLIAIVTAIGDSPTGSASAPSSVRILAGRHAAASRWPTSPSDARPAARRGPGPARRPA